MRTLSQAEIDQVCGAAGAISVGGVSITGIEAGMALRNGMGAAGVAFAAGYGAGTVINAVYTAASGQSLGTDIYQWSH